MNPVCSKVKYGSQESAQEYIDIKLKKKYGQATAMGTYKCSLCGAWHVTSVFSDVVSLEKYEAAVKKNAEYEAKILELKTLVSELKGQLSPSDLDGTEYARLNAQVKRLNDTINQQRKTINELICKIARTQNNQNV